MAKKQNAYLASLLAADISHEPSIEKQTEKTSETPQISAEPRITPLTERPTARAGLSLLGRENALARVASGEVRQITQLLIDPARVRIWAGNARIQKQLSEENCRDLIDSILAEGGQKVAAVVRHLSGDPDHDYELIAGTRRHFSISWLRANNYPDMKLLAQVAELDDEAAFRLADIENRARKDISDIERARNYAEAVDRHYGGKAVRMAERLNLSKGWLSKMLKAATLPDAILSAFGNLTELSLNPAYKLAVAMDDKLRAKIIRKEAELIAADNRKAMAQGLPPLAGAAAMARLMAAKADTIAPAPNLEMDIQGKMGRTIMSVKNVNRQGITLHLPMASGADDDEYMDAVRQIIAMLRSQGVELK
ncbi:ParB/RepB/Spo0J family partition protein [Sphingopyxis yananensis]|uniref:ParB/RepB/Spo0J family partition protein n=1 Tax=Sphingopyxis yananensis TaxID=2886687 RepID=UPI001D10818F|nr:ParB/RepB/Spo0J family partition protein [Sphingopyxis yananensis]MCC2603685.1 ParB/RepB/Spo0J family partition protein [Sphingopyxis yananensis]